MYDSEIKNRPKVKKKNRKIDSHTHKKCNLIQLKQATIQNFLKLH